MDDCAFSEWTHRSPQYIQLRFSEVLLRTFRAGEPSSTCTTKTGANERFAILPTVIVPRLFKILPSSRGEFEQRHVGVDLCFRHHHHHLVFQQPAAPHFFGVESLPLWYSSLLRLALEKHRIAA